MLASPSFFGEHIRFIPGHHCISWIVCLSSVIFVSLGSLRCVLIGKIGPWNGLDSLKVDCLALDDVVETKCEVSTLVVSDVQATEWSAFTLVVQEHEHLRVIRVHNREASGSLGLKRETDGPELLELIGVFGSNKLNMIAILMHALQEDELFRLDDGLYVVEDLLRGYSIVIRIVQIDAAFRIVASACLLSVHDSVIGNEISTHPVSYIVGEDPLKF